MGDAGKGFFVSLHVIQDLVAESLDLESTSHGCAYLKPCRMAGQALLAFHFPLVETELTCLCFHGGVCAKVTDELQGLVGQNRTNC